MTRRRHEPDVDAAAYVTGIMGTKERRRFERHLMTCESCWREVRLDRQGRRLAELGRESAPADLRESVRAAVAAGAEPDVPVALAEQGQSTRGSSPGRRLRMRVPALAVALALLVLVGSLAWSRSAGEPAPISAALDTYASSSVATMDHHMMPPDLDRLGLAPMGSEMMMLADMPVEAFAYRSDDGTRLTLYMAHTPFPPATEARAGAGYSWRAQHDGMTLLGDSSPVAYLAISDDSDLVGRFQGALTDGSVTIS